MQHDELETMGREGTGELRGSATGVCEHATGESHRSTINSWS